MATYRGLEQLLTDSLGDYKNIGYRRYEADSDHLIILEHKGEEVAKFSATGATPMAILEECHRHFFYEHGVCYDK